MRQDELGDLIGKFRSKEITDEELLRLKLFLQQPESEEMLKGMDFSKLPVLDDELTVDTAEAYREVRHRIGLSSNEYHGGGSSKLHRIGGPGTSSQAERGLMRRFYWAAASVAAVFLLAVGGYWMGRGKGVGEKAAVRWTTVQTSRGQHRKIVLPDGTTVYLGAVSRLEYPVSFQDDSTRQVRLDGEAFFDIAGNARQPFLLHTSFSDTRVLGTHFNVEAYGNERITRVALLEGKVATGRRGQPLILRPGDMMELENGTGIQSVRPIAVNARQWNPGGLVLNEMPLREALQRISNFYGISMEADSAIVQSFSITGSFDQEKPERVLDVLLDLYGLHWKLVNERYIIYR